MKNIRKGWIYILLVIGIILMHTNCKKEEDYETPPPEIPEIKYGLDVSDIDGNIYHTVIIDTQQWMVENLKTTKFNDGTSIPIETNNEAWIKLSSPAYCWYNNGASYKNTYGALYNWYAVNTGKLAPTGWHVPSSYEWEKLINFLGGREVASVKLRETGTDHWESPNNESTNEVGFTALPGGYRNAYGCKDMGEICYFWSTKSSTYLLLYSFNSVSVWEPWVNANSIGLSVRCVKD